jgi:cell division protein FtsB
MARNRRRVDGEVTFSWMAGKIVMFMVAVACLLGITFLKQRNLKMGDEIVQLDRELRKIGDLNASINSQVARCKAPRELEARMARLKLTMVHPAEHQIRRVAESTVQIASRARSAARPSGTLASKSQSQPGTLVHAQFIRPKPVQ